MTSVMADNPPQPHLARLPPVRSSSMTHMQVPTPGRSEGSERDGEQDRHWHLREGDVNADSGSRPDADRDDDQSSLGEDGPAKKKRRSRKGLDKKFACPHQNCNKSYSRAEHLYRHQLNHTPKTIYKCDVGDCKREFVRLDLRNRHKDRHTAKGSTLSRKESVSSLSGPMEGARPPYPVAGPVTEHPDPNRPQPEYANGTNGHYHYQSPKSASHSSPYTPVTASPIPSYPTAATGATAAPRSNVMDGYTQQAYHGIVENGYSNGPAPRQHTQHPTPGPPRPSIQTDVDPYGVMSPVSQQNSAFPNQPANTPQSASTPMSFVTQQNFPPFTLPPSSFPTPSPATATVPPREPARQYSQPQGPEKFQEPPQHTEPQPANDVMLMDHISGPAAISVFGEGVLNKSPYITYSEDFVAYLFNTGHGNGSPSMGHVTGPSNYGEYQQSHNMFNGVPMSYFPVNQPHQVMAVTNLVDHSLPEFLISEEKSQEVYDFVKDRFHESNHAPMERHSEILLEGDRSDGNHILSRNMMQAYIGSYWLHFNDQVPILHKPTFSPDKTPNLLLIAIMAIGAACLDRTHSSQMVRAGAQLSNFLAWHLRWEIFMDVNFRPPAKLWIFQALILLELYEKMFSTRELHERAHIHHATTIQLMRRGRSLIGKSAVDSPPNSRDERPGHHGSRSGSTAGLVNTPDEYWNHWITNEATRRTAFAAFLVDSIHATMFGHSTVMVAHEMRLPLPCEDQLWKATSGAEVVRIETNLYSNDVRPLSFLEGLKRTLAGQGVQTNPFGRQILMAGLLSVSWHMNQRDLQVSSLGGGPALGGRDKWRTTLTKAFDCWKSDFDQSLQQADPMQDPYSYEKRREAYFIFESRTVLHHLAHMAMHVDIVDIQIVARAKRLLGRAMGSADLHRALRRLKDHWAPSAKARDATFYALQFLRSVLLSHEGTAPSPDGYRQVFAYSARDDVLLNRSWVLYFAALVVWCYGHTLEGPCADTPFPQTDQEKTDQMRAYLENLGAVTSPEDLKVMRGVNKNSAMLMVLKDAFESTRWELLHEGAILLSNCIQINSGAASV